MLPSHLPWFLRASTVARVCRQCASLRVQVRANGTAAHARKEHKEPTPQEKEQRTIREKIRNSSTPLEGLTFFKKALDGKLLNSGIQFETIRRLCKASEVDGAIEILRTRKTANPWSYNTIISALASSNREKEALDLVEEMKQNGVSRDNHTFSPFLNMYFASGNIEKMREVLKTKEAEGIPLTTMDYNRTIEGALRAGKKELAEELLAEMRSKGVPRTEATYSVAMEGLTRAGSAYKALEICELMRKDGMEPTSDASRAGVIRTLFASGKIDEALREYERALAHISPESRVFESVLHGLARAHYLEDAIRLFRKDMANSSHAYAAIIQIMLANGRGDEALALALEAAAKRLPLHPYVVTYLHNSGHMRAVQEWLAAARKDATKTSAEAHTAVMQGLMNQRMVEEGYALLAQLRAEGELAAGLYNAMLAGLVNMGRVEEAMRVLARMRDDGISPDAQSFACLSRCAHFGHLKQAISVLELAQSQGVQPSEELYFNLASGYASIGNFVQAWNLVSQMPNLQRGKLGLKIHNDILHSMVKFEKAAIECEDVVKRMLFHQLGPDANTYEALIKLYLNEGDAMKAFTVFEKMKENIIPTEITKGLLEHTCRKTANMDWYNTHVE